VQTDVGDDNSSSTPAKEKAIMIDTTGQLQEGEEWLTGVPLCSYADSLHLRSELGPTTITPNQFGYSQSVSVEAGSSVSLSAILVGDQKIKFNIKNILLLENNIKKIIKDRQSTIFLDQTLTFRGGCGLITVLSGSFSRSVFTGMWASSKDVKVGLFDMRGNIVSVSDIASRVSIGSFRRDRVREKTDGNAATLDKKNKVLRFGPREGISLEDVISHGRWEELPSDVRFKSDYHVLLYSCDPYSEREDFCGFPSSEGKLMADPPSLVKIWIAYRKIGERRVEFLVVRKGPGAQTTINALSEFSGSKLTIRTLS